MEDEWQRWLDRMQQTKQTVELAELFLSDAILPEIDLQEKQTEMHKYWLEAMQQHHEATFDDCPMSEALFLSLCVIRCCQNADLREKIPLDKIYETALGFILPCCCHHRQFLQPYDVNAFYDAQHKGWSDAIAFTVQHFIYGPTAVELELKSKSFQPSEAALPADIRERWEQLQLTIATDADRQVSHKKQLASIQGRYPLEAKLFSFWPSTKIHFFHFSFFFLDNLRTSDPFNVLGLSEKKIKKMKKSKNGEGQNEKSWCRRGYLPHEAVEAFFTFSLFHFFS